MMFYVIDNFYYVCFSLYAYRRLSISGGGDGRAFLRRSRGEEEMTFEGSTDKSNDKEIL
jgi:hypothetical protein